jgi:hypothetical protein
MWLGACPDSGNRSIQFFRDQFWQGVRIHHSSKEVILSWRPPVGAGFGHQLLFPLRLQLSLRRPQILALQTYYPRTKSRDLLKGKARSSVTGMSIHEGISQPARA